MQMILKLWYFRSTGMEFQLEFDIDIKLIYLLIYFFISLLIYIFIYLFIYLFKPGILFQRISPSDGDEERNGLCVSRVKYLLLK